MTVRNILFDLGGVIINLNMHRSISAFADLGLEQPESLMGPFGQKGPFGKLEEGMLTPEEFRTEVRNLLPEDRRADVSDDDIDEAFGLFLKDLPKHRLKALRNLRNTHRVYLLSNTNPIMWDRWISDMFRAEGLEREDYFDGIVTSFEAKCLKPAPRIFEHAAKALGIVPEETLFLDDGPANIDAAKALGFQARLVPPGMEFVEIISRFLNE